MTTKKSWFSRIFGFGQKEEVADNKDIQVQEAELDVVQDQTLNTEVVTDATDDQSESAEAVSEIATNPDSLTTELNTDSVNSNTISPYTAEELKEQFAQLNNEMVQSYNQTKQEVSLNVAHENEAVENYQQQGGSRTLVVDSLDNSNASIQTLVNQTKPNTDQDLVNSNETSVCNTLGDIVDIATTQEAFKTTATQVNNQPEQSNTQQAALESSQIQEMPQAPQAPAKKGFFSRLVSGLSRTSATIGAGIARVFVGKKISKELFYELEEKLLLADVGIDTTDKIISNLNSHVKLADLKDSQAVYNQLKVELKQILEPCQQPLEIKEHSPFLILMVGVNGVGKTTTIGKLTKKLQAEGKSVLLAAADTFRAAAIEQLQEWGNRNNVQVIAQKPGSDSAAVIYDAMQSAKARGIDVVIADTAGRLQNKAHLLEELKKITRVVKKIDPEAPHEVLITLDAATGQNALSQVDLFNQAVNVTGIVLTKLDGTAKGGIIFAICDKFKKPIRFIGVGESIDDLQPFEADKFIEALYSTN